MRKLNNVLHILNEIVLGKEEQTRLALTCMLSQGHLLIEDLPGLGKTTLAHALSKIMGLSYQRLQFTSDMLPADIIGVSIFDQNSSQFRFHEGPVFTQVLLADEINRATPKAQSALLEAMEEKNVSVDGKSYSLPKPFFVIATQNPISQVGTFPLPESQLDRFLMRIHMGYPTKQAELNIYKGEDRRVLLKHLEPVIDVVDLLKIQEQIQKVHTSDLIIEYIHALVTYSRDCADFMHGLSPRAGLGLLKAAKTWAFLDERGHVEPEDVQSVLSSIVSHRLYIMNDNRGNIEYHGAAEQMIDAVPVPI